MQTDVELVSSDRLLHRLGLPIELISDRRPNEVGSIGVEPLLHQQIDVAEIDVAEIDRDLLAVACSRPKFPNIIGHAPSVCHPYTIHTDGYGAGAMGHKGLGSFDRRVTPNFLEPDWNAAPSGLTSSGIAVVRNDPGT